MGEFLRTRTWSQWLIFFGVLLFVVAVCINDLLSHDLTALFGFLAFVGIGCVIAGRLMR
jgi:hypothetical protein